MAQQSRVYSGACHCGAVRFRVTALPTALSRCNCSICSMKGALYVKVSQIEALKIETSESLSCYQFNTHRAKHYFCKHCGIHVFHRPRLAPELWSANARCLKGLLIDSFPVTEFDGQNWEQQAVRDGWISKDEAARLGVDVSRIREE